MNLVSLMVGSAIASLLLSAVSSFTMYTGKSLAAMSNYVELDNYSRGALDRMSKEIRQTVCLTRYATNELAFLDADGKELSYAYDVSGRQLLRTKDGAQETLLKGCEFLRFSIYQRNPINGTYDQYPVATTNTCKLVQLTWVCSRSIFGAKVNTESMQSAKIVIRKQ